MHFKLMHRNVKVPQNLHQINCSYMLLTHQQNKIV